MIGQVLNHESHYAFNGEPITITSFTTRKLPKVIEVGRFRLQIVLYHVTSALITNIFLADRIDEISSTMFQLCMPRSQKADSESAEYLFVLGAGLPRTGTLSLRNALEVLGFGPCHHMAELHAKPERSVQFARALDGDQVDFYDLMKGYGSTLDLPTAFFYKEIHQVYPKAKIILTVRDSSARWYESFKVLEPIFADNSYLFSIYPVRFLRLQCLVVRKIYQKWVKEYGGVGPWVHDQHNAKVIRENAKREILVFNVKQGWEPLCKFLGVEVPQRVPFPSVNDTNQLKRMIILRKTLGALFWACICVLIVTIAYILPLFTL